MNILDIKVGFACNNKCVHCVITDKSNNPSFSLEEIKKFIDKNNDKDYYIITGGEPTIRKDLLEICYYIKNNTCGKIILQTNGRQFALFDDAKIKEYISLISTFLIAVHSSDNIIHDKITGVDGSWQETILGLKRIYSIEPKKINTQTVISKYNAYTLYDTYSFIQHNFPGVAMNMTFPHPNGNAFINFKDVVPQYNDIKNEMQKCFHSFGKFLRTEAIPYCYINEFKNRIQCMESSLLEDNNISGFDNGHKNGYIEDYKLSIISEHKKSDNCINCSYNNECVGVWKEYLDLNKDDLIPIKKHNIKILLKSKSFNGFNRFFESFAKFYPEYIPDLYVLSNGDKEYYGLADTYGFKLNNFELKYDKIVKIYDDIIFHNYGFIDYISTKLDEYGFLYHKNYNFIKAYSSSTDKYCIDDDIDTIIGNNIITKYYRTKNDNT